MSYYNPYQSPSSPLFGGGQSAREAARSAVRGPAICLISVSAFAILIFIVAIIFDVFLLASDLPEQMQEPGGFNERTTTVVRLTLAIVSIAFQSLILAGAICMLRLKCLGLAQTSAVLSVIPCCSSCYLLGIPFGIWALVVLARPEVQSAFD